MTNADIKHLRDLAAQATPGPWRREYSAGEHWVSQPIPTPTGAWPVPVARHTNAADAEYLAACSPEQIVELCDQLLMDGEKDPR